MHGISQVDPWIEPRFQALLFYAAFVRIGIMLACMVNSLHISRVQPGIHWHYDTFGWL